MMMVPRSFRYSSPPHNKSPYEKTQYGHDRAPVSHKIVSEKASPETALAKDSAVRPAKPASKPVAVPRAHDRTRSRDLAKTSTPEKRTRQTQYRSASSQPHDPHALPPAVAALLAVTAIPPRRTNTLTRQKASRSRQISIHELVCEWKSDELLGDSYGSSPGLSALLEDVDVQEGQILSCSEGTNSYLRNRSLSSDSVPSLESDGQSLASLQSLTTPGSLRSHRSMSSFKKERARSMTVIESCASDHPLAVGSDSLSDEDPDALFFAPSSNQTSLIKSKSSFRSNLTSSLHALKNAALNSISSLGRNSPSASPSNVAKSKTVAPFSDDMLWSHPFLFPHFSSEVRPQLTSAPTEAQRRYLNPMPLTFEEQEAPFQRALHAPYLAEQIADDQVTTIPMQTYNRSNHNRKKSRNTSASEAGRVLLGVAGVRQREPRENSDFLRVVVLEMNMRRQGKIEGGRARIWLPPRENSKPSSVMVEIVTSPGHGRGGMTDDEKRPNPISRVIPERWQGISAY